jgi:ketosteroid isomerase-like protein
LWSHDEPSEETTMTAPTISTPVRREHMDALVDGHYRAEENGDLAAVVAGFRPDAAHDVVGRPGPVLQGSEAIGEFYRALLAELRIDRFEPVSRRYGDDHVTDESLLHATAVGNPFGMPGRGRPVTVRFLHVFDFADGLISRETAWIDLAALQQQLAG